MRSLVKFGFVTFGSGLILGLIIVAYLHAYDHPQDSAMVDAANSGTRGAGGLQVINDGNQGAALMGSQSDPGSAEAQNQSSGSGDGASASPNSVGSQLPTPSQFHIYDQYKNNPTALYVDVQPGNGTVVGKGSVVTMQYRGWLTNGEEFGETYDKGQPMTFTEGAGTVIPGMEEAIFGMKAGGTRRLIIPPAVGYGAQGKGPIPPDSVLVLDVQLESVH